jgi:hypothetical protein
MHAWWRHLSSARRRGVVPLRPEMGPFDGVRGRPLDESLDEPTVGALIDIAQGFQDRKLEGLSCVEFYIHKPCAPFPHSHAIYLQTLS